MILVSQNVINLGQGIYAFVKYINKWLGDAGF